MAVLFSLSLAAIASAAEVETGDSALDAAFAQILDRDFDVKLRGVDAIADSGHPRAGQLLRGLIEGDLRLYKKTKRLVLTREEGSSFELTDAVTGEAIGTAKKREVKRLPINNPMRGRIQTLLAGLDLRSPDAAVRLAA
ncbi:MAG: urea ABC transporter permease subunit UrtB, partial [Gammaproteobacteria bacterium]